MKRSDPTIDHLRTVSLFSACTDEELRLIAGRTTRVSFEEGDVLARQGATGRELVVLVDGRATVRIGEREVASLGPGDFFGEVALLDNGARTATVTADTAGAAEVMGQGEFASLLDDAPHMVKKMLVGVAARLRAVDVQLTS